MTHLLAGKAGLVVGASSGIGEAAAEVVAREGARVAVAARRLERLEALVDRIRAVGGEAVAIQADATQAKDHAHMVKATREAFGSFDFAFNNAGTLGEFVPLLEQSDAAFQHTIDTNLRAVWHGLRAQAAGMRALGGAIVNNSSWLSAGALVGSSMYSASKAALDGLVRPAAVELAPLGIRVNNINPGGIDTQMTRDAFSGDEDQLSRFGRAHPRGRLGTPHEVAELVLFLVSERAQNITGQTLFVDGGYSIPGQRVPS